eukprot:Nk52_evm29s265 gene=Nk52_evmTU29s265
MDILSVPRRLVASPEGERPVPNHLLETQRFIKLKENDSFQVEPAMVHFPGIKLNHTHVQKLKIINRTGTQKRVIIVPPETPYFSIKYRKKTTLRPGLSEDIEVEFTPTEYKYYGDSIRLYCYGDQNLIIPIHGYPTINTIQFPTRVDFTKAAISQSVTKSIPLSSDVPIDFSFEVNIPKPHPFFTVFPERGTIPGNGQTKIDITFLPQDYTTAMMTLEINISQFNFVPFVCEFSGCALPGEEQLKKMKELNAINGPDDDETAQRKLGISVKPDVLFDPKMFNAHVGKVLNVYLSHRERRRQRQKHGTKREAKTVSSKGEEEKTVNEFGGIRFPDNLNSISAVSFCLTQQPGKLKLKELRDLVEDRKRKQQHLFDKKGDPKLQQGQMQRAKTMTRQMKEIVFQEEIKNRVTYEKSKGAHWFTCRGDDGITDEEKAKILQERENNEVDNPEVETNCLYDIEEIEVGENDEDLLANVTKYYNENEVDAGFDERFRDSLKELMPSEEDEKRKRKIIVKTVKPHIQKILNRKETELSKVRIIRDVHHIPNHTPTFNSYLCDDWMRRFEALKRFKQAVMKVILRKRMKNRLASLRQFINQCGPNPTRESVRNLVEEDYKFAHMSKASGTVINKNIGTSESRQVNEGQCFSPNPDIHSSLTGSRVSARPRTRETLSRQLSPDKELFGKSRFNTNLVKKFTLPILKHDPLSFEGGDELAFEDEEMEFWNLHFFKPKVPLEYNLLGYEEQDYDEAQAYVRQFNDIAPKTGALDEIASMVEIEKASGFAGVDEIYKREAPMNSLYPLNYASLHIFNQYPGCVCFMPIVPYTEISTEYNFDPTQRNGELIDCDKYDYVVEDTISSEPRPAGTELSADYGTSWKRLTCQTLIDAPNFPTTTDVWIPRWSNCFGDILLSEDIPSMLNELPEDDAMSEDSDFEDELEVNEDGDFEKIARSVPSPSMIDATFFIPPDNSQQQLSVEQEGKPYSDITLPASNQCILGNGIVSRKARENELNIWIYNQLNKVGSSVKQKEQELNERLKSNLLGTD